MKTNTWVCLAGVVLSTLAGCSIEDAEIGSGGGATTGQSVSRIQVDGSSTVEKITSAIAEKFESQFADVQIPVKVTGTGTGFKEMIAGRIDIGNASRAIKDSERAECDKNGIELLELTVALDGLAVCVSTENDWCDSITVSELKKIWAPGSSVRKWNDVRSEWPDQAIKLYGPGEESGTFDYFTEAINGKEDLITENYSPSADDNVILAGVSGDKYAMGFFGCAYYFLNKEKVKALRISVSDNPADGIELTPEAVTDGHYKPLSRPLFIYVRKSALQRREVEDFVRFYLSEGQACVAAVGYVPLKAEDLAASVAAFEAALSSGG